MAEIKPQGDIAKLIKESDAQIADLNKQLTTARARRSDLVKIADGRALAAKHGV